MAKYSKNLLKLMDDATNRPSKVRLSQITRLDPKELCIYLEWLNDRGDDIRTEAVLDCVSKFDKLVNKEE